MYYFLSKNFKFKTLFVLICFFGSLSISSADTKIDIGSSLIEKSGIIEANSEKLKIDVFQYTELEEGLNAVPASPIPPALESGVMAIKGRAVVMVFSCNWSSVTPLPPVGCANENVVETAIINVKSVFFISNLKVDGKYTQKSMFYCAIYLKMTNFSVFSAEEPFISFTTTLYMYTPFANWSP